MNEGSSLLKNSSFVARFLRLLFFMLVVRPIALVVIGLNVRHRERLPKTGPAILVANHNSHLDTFILMSLFPWSLREKIRPVAAMDYFCSNRFSRWFSLTIMHIIPIERKFSSYHKDPLEPISRALEQGDLVIIYPEGSRGEPEQLATFKTGVSHLAERHPGIPIIPIFLHGLGKSLPRGEAILVPFFCDAFVGEPLRWAGDKSSFMQRLTEAMTALASEGHFPPWV